VPDARRAPHRDLLLANHQFPGNYVIKAFGPATEQFVRQVRAAIVDRIDAARTQFRERRSSGGNKVCVTADLEVTTVDELISVYESLYEVPGLSLVL